MAMYLQDSGITIEGSQRYPIPLSAGTYTAVIEVIDTTFECVFITITDQSGTASISISRAEWDTIVEAMK